MIENFKTDLIVRAAVIPPEEILKAMEYLNPTSANAERPETVLESPDFGLSHYKLKASQFY
ncbi:hypothetical protein [Marinobacter salexigens]|uniref:hypothetical protein n=1 Tax=Marinobacter salexigens TaxID=1925763 RepID=UPI000C28EC09|nr:hypothetical protein [Marinobacter salexigens]